MAKKKTHKGLAGAKPFPGHARVMEGEPATHLKHGTITHKKSRKFVNSMVSTGHVKGPLKVSGKGKSTKKRTHTKA